MTTLTIGRAPAVKTAGQLAAEARNRAAARRELAGRMVDAACTAVLGVAFVLVLVAG